MRMLAAEAKEPLRSEFRAVLDQTMLGIPLGEAVMKLHERIPTPEANFFSIVMSIQAKSGGSLAETLGNLARVLRDRKKMKAKISAMSQEAKSSAAIIGALPFLVTGLVYMSAPEYIILLFNTHTGNMMLLACIFWMTCGVLVMRHMINFDF
jgi:tight adherence protein B